MDCDEANAEHPDESEMLGAQMASGVRFARAGRARLRP